MLRAHRNSAADSLQSLLSNYISSLRPARESAGPPTHESLSRDDSQGRMPDQASLREQIDSVRRAAQNALPIVTLIRQLDDLAAVRQAWDEQANRLALLARVAHAVEPYLAFPRLVYETRFRSHRDAQPRHGRLARQEYTGHTTAAGRLTAALRRAKTVDSLCVQLSAKCTSPRTRS